MNANGPSTCNAAAMSHVDVDDGSVADDHQLVSSGSANYELENFVGGCDEHNREPRINKKVSLEEFQLKQKMIEEQNEGRHAMLTKAIADRKRETMAETEKLSGMQAELQKLYDSLIVSNDVATLRNEIEVANLEINEIRERYEKAEREVVEAKVDLFRKMERKEKLTEHLCRIIEENELRKAKKLSDLMDELEFKSLRDDECMAEMGSSDAGALTDQVLAAEALPNSTPPRTTRTEQGRVSPEPLITLPKTPPSASLILPKAIPPPPPQLPMGGMNVDYSTTPSNRPMELMIESEGLKGQLQVIDRRIAKCLQMRTELLSRMQTIDAERLLLVHLIVQQPQQQPNIDAASSLPLGFADLEKYILRDKPAKRRKSAVAKRINTTAVAKNSVSKATDKAASKSSDKAKTSNDTTTTTTATTTSAQSNFSVTSKTSVFDSEKIEILEVRTRTTTTTAAASITVSASHDISGTEVPPPVTPTPRVLPPPAPPMTLQPVNIASTPARHAHQPSSDKQSEDTAKRKNIDISSATKSNGDKRSKVDELSPDHICLQGEPRIVHLFGHIKPVNFLRVHNDNVFSSSSDGTIKRYSPLKEEKFLDVRVQLIHNHQYLHNSKSVCGLDIFVTKEDWYVIVCTRVGILKKFQSNSKKAFVTNHTKKMTCMTIRWNKVYAGTQIGKIMRFCALKLKYELTLPCSDHPVTCLGTAMEGACRILVGGSLGGDVNVRDAFSGLLNRRLRLRPDRYPTALVVVQDCVFTQAAIKEANYEIYIHNVETGDLLHVVEDPSGIKSYFVSAVDPNSVYFTAFNGYVYKYRSDGGRPVKLDCGLIRGDPSLLYLHKNMIIIGSQQGHLEAHIYKGKCCCALETPYPLKWGFICPKSVDIPHVEKISKM